MRVYLKKGGYDGGGGWGGITRKIRNSYDDWLTKHTIMSCVDLLIPTLKRHADENGYIVFNNYSGIYAVRKDSVVSISEDSITAYCDGTKDFEGLDKFTMRAVQGRYKRIVTNAKKGDKMVLSMDNKVKLLEIAINKFGRGFSREYKEMLIALQCDIDKRKSEEK